MRHNGRNSTTPTHSSASLEDQMSNRIALMYEQQSVHCLASREESESHSSHRVHVM
jgi:hypothetical protein